MPDAYFDSYLNSNISTDTGIRVLYGISTVSPLDSNLSAYTAAAYYLDGNIDTLRTNSAIRTLISVSSLSPSNENTIGLNGTQAALPYRLTRNPVITSRFTD